MSSSVMTASPSPITYFPSKLMSSLTSQSQDLFRGFGDAEPVDPQRGVPNDLQQLPGALPADLARADATMDGELATAPSAAAVVLRRRQVHYPARKITVEGVRLFPGSFPLPLQWTIFCPSQRLWSLTTTGPLRCFLSFFSLPHRGQAA